MLAKVVLAKVTLVKVTLAGRLAAKLKSAAEGERAEMLCNGTEDGRGQKQ